MEKNEQSKHSSIWTNLIDIRLNQRSQTQNRQNVADTLCGDSPQHTISLSNPLLLIAGGLCDLLIIKEEEWTLAKFQEKPLAEYLYHLAMGVIHQKYW